MNRCQKKRYDGEQCRLPEHRCECLWVGAPLTLMQAQHWREEVDLIVGGTISPAKSTARQAVIDIAEAMAEYTADTGDCIVCDKLHGECDVEAECIGSELRAAVRRMRETT